MKPVLSKFYSKNIFSQFGEDGIIEQIFNVIDDYDDQSGVTNKQKICVEFGAWDGEYLSNTANLWKNKGWHAYLFEEDLTRVQAIRREPGSYSNVIFGCAKIGWNNDKDSIDVHLTNLDVDDVDFMSIDIDGNDYYIFENLIRRPKVICIEYNPTIPFWIDVYQKPDQQFGASLAAMNRLAEEKNYFLAAVTDSNLFFIQNDYFGAFDLQFNLDLVDMVCYKHYISTITDYTGKQMMIGNPPYGLKGDLNKDSVIGI